MTSDDATDVGQPDAGPFKTRRHDANRLNTPNSARAWRISKPTPLSRTKKTGSPRAPPSSRFRSEPVAGAGVFDRIGYQIHSTWPSMAGSPCAFGRRPRFQNNVSCLNFRMQLSNCCVDQGFKIHHGVFHFRSGHVREGQQIVDELGHFLHRSRDHAQIALPLLVQFVPRAVP